MEQNKDDLLHCILCLEKMGKIAVTALVRLLADETLTTKAKIQVAKSLGVLKSEQVIGALVGAAQSDEKPLSKSAIKSLRKITKQKIGNEPSEWAAWFQSENRNA